MVVPGVSGWSVEDEGPSLWLPGTRTLSDVETVKDEESES